MKHSVPFRITVASPVRGVTMRVQKGSDELVLPTSTTESAMSFDFEVTVDLDGGSPNFLGKFAHGPKNGRFVYVNSGTLAGQTETCWSRRAKLSLMSITRKQIEEVLANPRSRIETTMPGTGSDGGPTCASVKGIEWRVAAR